MTFLPAKLEPAIARLEALQDRSARESAREALSSILELHSEGLKRLLGRIRETSPDGDRILQAAIQDDIVASLLLLHGLHPLPLEARIRRALGRARAESHGEAGRIEVLSINQTTIRLRVAGSESLRHLVARAALEAAPEVEHIEVLRSNPSVIRLGRLVERRESNHEQCDLCGEALASKHEHLFDIEHRRLRCACTACSVLFDTPSAKIRRIRRQAIGLEGFRISEAQWDALKVPVGLAFFSRSSSLGEVIAAYPGPAGAVEAPVPKPAWEDLVKDNPVLAAIDADTSALLVDRQTAKPTYHVLSIDECYRLTGIIRSRWQGLTGGDGPVRAVKEFFHQLAEVQS